MELQALIPYCEILERFGRLLAVISNFGGVTKIDVDEKIADLETSILCKVDDLNESGRKLSALEKCDIRSQFTSVCRSYRFDDDQKSAMIRIRTRLSKELDVKIPESVNIISRSFFQSRSSRR